MGVILLRKRSGVNPQMEQTAENFLVASAQLVLKGGDGVSEQLRSGSGAAMLRLWNSNLQAQPCGKSVNYFTLAREIGRH